MLSFVFADANPMSRHAVVSAARTGDLLLYCSVSTSSVAAKRSGPFVPTIGQCSETAKRKMSFLSLLSMSIPAIACTGGERETLAELDCVGVVVEKPNGDTGILIYDSHHTLTMQPLAGLTNRPACLRPLMIVNENSNARRMMLHRLLQTTVNDLCLDRLSATTQERAIQSQCFLAAFLLFTAGILHVPAQDFCSTRQFMWTAGTETEQLFGAEALYLDNKLTRDYAYGNQIWLS
jgi:hypothetical protein